MTIYKLIIIVNTLYTETQSIYIPGYLQKLIENTLIERSTLIGNIALTKV